MSFAVRSPWMFAELSEAARKAVARYGTPLPLLDGTSGQPYILLTVDISPAPLDGVRAQVEGLPSIGEGDTPEDALLALTVALRQYLGTE